MDRNSIVWIVECCILNLDGCTKESMLEYGAPEEFADMGITLCELLKLKNNSALPSV